MEAEEIIAQENTQDLCQQVQEMLCKKYRVEPAHAHTLTVNLLLRDRAMLDLLKKDTSVKELSRTKVFKLFRKRISERTYYALRQYNQQKQEQEALLAQLKMLGPDESPSDIHSLFHQLAATHLSTKERLTEAEQFYSQLQPYLSEAKSLVDIGCGLHPLMFPFQDYPQLEDYVALERDQTCSDILNAASSGLNQNTTEFRYHQWQLLDGWTILGAQTFDIGLLLKIVPVVARQDTELLSLLAAVPADRLVITGSMISMTKNQRIDRRERKVISKFISEAGRTELQSFEIGEELVYVVE